MKSYNKSYDRFMFNQIKAILTTYFSHIVQVQASGFHTSVGLLNSSKDLQFLIFWGIRTHILGPGNLTNWKLHEDLYFQSVIKIHYYWSTSYLCNKHCVNILFVDPVQKTFKRGDTPCIREYCGYALKFVPDCLEAGRRSLSCIDIIDTV